MSPTYCSQLNDIGKKFNGRKEGRKKRKEKRNNREREREKTNEVVVRSAYHTKIVEGNRRRLYSLTAVGK